MGDLCPVTEPASGSLECRFYLFSLAPFPSLFSFHIDWLYRIISGLPDG